MDIASLFLEQASSQDFPLCLASLTSLDRRPKNNLEEKKLSPILFIQKFYLKLLPQFHNCEIFPSKKEESNLRLLFILVFANPRKFEI